MSAELQAGRRDKYITRQIQRLFSAGNFQYKTALVVAYLCRIPATALYNVLIPLASAYAIQGLPQNSDKIARWEELGNERNGLNLPCWPPTHTLSEPLHISPLAM